MLKTYWATLQCRLLCSLKAVIFTANYLQILLYDISSVLSELSWLCFAEITYQHMVQLFLVVSYCIHAQSVPEYNVLFT